MSKNQLSWRLIEFFSRELEPSEREAVLGDLAEQDASFSAVRDVLDLLVRRQAALWVGWRPWLVLWGLTIPFALQLSLASRFASDGSAQVVWLYKYGQHDVLLSLVNVSRRLLNLVCWSWGYGYVIGLASRRTLGSSSVLLCLALILGELFGVPVLAPAYPRTWANLHTAPVFAGVVVNILLVMLPSIAAIYQARRFASFHTRSRRVLLIAALLPVLGTLLQCLTFWMMKPASWASAWTSQPASVIGILVYWPILYWFATAVQRRRRFQIA